ncbi:Calcineurin-like phosphoesterase [Maridesulfovibrio ferrireducens]|uniref:Calcineurin-like phosphoesterase n=1 Tax=Maridesulfovibrio ferrireducens TaxID=246191 RepID=A0A1G9EQ50_9BACT|nr:metallophosphoesterase [Maridesulfovibrio ferrireducens]SDK78312.1 Calcineurin-like phosphoesterase [Maridesulfovibrio ferrireducens]
MGRYKIFIIDDSYTERASLFKKIIDNSSLLSNNYDIEYNIVDETSSPVQPILDRAQSADLILLDMFLSDNSDEPFQIKQKDKYINILDKLGQKEIIAPIFIVSEMWGKDQLRNYKSSLINRHVQGSINVRESVISDAKYLDQCSTNITNAIIRSKGGHYIDISQNAPLKIIHLSDLQFGGKWTGGDSLKTKVQEDVRLNLCTEIERHIHRGAPLPNALIISGDIAQTGSLEEYIAATNFIKELLKEINIPQDSCFICPGNHDVHIPSTGEPYLKFTPPSDDDQNTRLELLKEKVDGSAPEINRGLLNFRQFAYSLTRKREWSLDFSNLDQEEGNTFFHSPLFSFYGLNIFGLNTANEISYQTSDFKKGEILGYPAKLFKKQLKRYKESYPENLNVIISHHPIIKHSTNKTICEQLPEGTKNIFLFGHRHENIQGINIPDQGAEGFIYSCAPTLTLDPKYREAHVPAGFNSILIERDKGIPVKVTITQHISTSQDGFITKEMEPYNITN